MASRRKKKEEEIWKYFRIVVWFSARKRKTLKVHQYARNYMCVYGRIAVCMHILLELLPIPTHQKNIRSWDIFIYLINALAILFYSTIYLRSNIFKNKMSKYRFLKRILKCTLHCALFWEDRRTCVWRLQYIYSISNSFA